MDRALYPSLVEVLTTALSYTETSKISAILENAVDNGQTGVVDGLQCSVSANTLQVNVSPGRAQLPNGEKVSLTQGSVGLSMGDYTLDAYNYVVIGYSETESVPQANAVDGTTSTTRVTVSARVSVYTNDGLLALPTTSENYDVDALDRISLIGVIQANGPGIALTAARITSAPEPQRYATANQPTNISGVVLVRFSQDFPASFDTIRADGPNSSMRLSFTAPNLSVRAPGDTAAGSDVDVSGGGPFTLYTDGSAYSLDVQVTAATLPDTATTITDDIEVTSIYEPVAPIGHARDELHRSQVGTGLPTANNPHGITLADILVRSLTLPETITLGTGLLTTDVQADIPRITTSVNTSGDRTLLWYMPGTTAARSTRLYLERIGGGTLHVTNGVWDSEAGEWSKDDTSADTYVMGIGQTFLLLYRASGAGTWTDFGWTIQGLTDPTTTGGTFNLGGQLYVGGNNLASAAAVAVPRFEASFASGAGLQRTLIFRSARNDAAAGATVRVYRSQNGAYGVTDVYTNETAHNAIWDEGTDTWSADVATTYTSSKFETGPNGTNFYSKTSNTGTWADSAWDVVFRMDPVNNYFSAPDFLFSPGADLYHSVPLMGVRVITGTGGSTFIGTLGVASDPTSLRPYIDKQAGSDLAAIIPVHLPDGAIIPLSASTSDAVRLEFEAIAVTTSVRVALLRYGIGSSGVPESFQSSGSGYTSSGSGTPLSLDLTIDAAVGVRTVDTENYQYYIGIYAATADTFTLANAYVRSTMSLIRFP